MVTIRHYKESDLQKLHELLSNKENMYFLDDIATNILEETEENLKHAMFNEDGNYFCIIEEGTGEFVGSVGYTVTDINPLGKIGHMGFFILPKFQGKGYTAKAARDALGFAFEHDSVVRMTTGCHKDNVASSKVIVKAGFRLEGERVKAVYHDGVMKDRLEYGVGREEFLG